MNKKEKRAFRALLDVAGRKTHRDQVPVARSLAEALQAAQDLPWWIGSMRGGRWEDAQAKLDDALDEHDKYIIKAHKQANARINFWARIRWT